MRRTQSIQRSTSRGLRKATSSGSAVTETAAKKYQRPEQGQSLVSATNDGAQLFKKNRVIGSNLGLKPE